MQESFDAYFSSNRLVWANSSLPKSTVVRKQVLTSQRGAIAPPEIVVPTADLDPNRAPPSPRRKTASNKTKAALQCALPLSLAPRGLSRDQSAAYIGTSTTKFDQLIADDLMPQPKLIGARRVWDRHALDVAFSALPDADGNAEYPSDIWSRAKL